MKRDKPVLKLNAQTKEEAFEAINLLRRTAERYHSALYPIKLNVEKAGNEGDQILLVVHGQSPHQVKETIETNIFRGRLDIQYRTWVDAARILVDLNTMLENYGCVLLDDFYERIDFPLKNGKKPDIGWIDLSSGRVYKSSSGYKLRLPFPQKLGE